MVLYEIVITPAILCYRPQRSWAKVIFSQACVKNSVHGGGEGVCLSACWDTHTPPSGADTPPGADPLPRSRHHPPEQTPPRQADCSIRSMSGRYASYWNAFLFILFLSWGDDYCRLHLGSCYHHFSIDYCFHVPSQQTYKLQMLHFRSCTAAIPQ